jgi:hypothetical protein
VFQTGWIDFNDRTRETHEAHERILGDMPSFRIVGSTKTPATKKVVLTQIWRHPAVKAALGFEFPRVHQLTGSCVGAGGVNCDFTLLATEVVNGDREVIKVPFWPFTYGKSRQRAGMRGRGEGSIGSAYAEAARLDGYLDPDLDGLPKFTNSDGLVLTSQIEMQWSDGAAIPDKYVQAAKPRVVGTTAPCKTADDVREAILNLYPCTDACSGFVNRAQVRGTGDDAVLMGDIDSRGGHQTSIQGWMEHPTFGELFNYQNNWPASVYPSDPAGGAVCSLWITKKRMQWICDQGEVYAFSNMNGFPAQDVEKVLFRVIGG